MRHLGSRVFHLVSPQRRPGCSTVSNRRWWEEDEFWAQTADLNNSTEMELSCLWNSSKAAFIYSWHFKQTRGCVIWEVAHKQWLFKRNLACAKWVYTDATNLPSLLKYLFHISAVEDSHQEVQTKCQTQPIPFKWWVLLQGKIAPSAKNLMSFFLLCFLPFNHWGHSHRTAWLFFTVLPCPCCVFQWEHSCNESCNQSQKWLNVKKVDVKFMWREAALTFGSPTK